MRPNRAVVLWTPVALLCLQILSPASARADTTPMCLGRGGDDRRDHRSGPPDGDQIRSLPPRPSMMSRPERPTITSSPKDSLAAGVAPTGCSAARATIA